MLVVRVDQFLGRAGCLDQDAEPAEWINMRMVAPRAGRDRLQRNPVAAVAASDEIARQLHGLAVVLETNTRLWRVHVVQTRVLDFKDDAAAGMEARGK